MIELVGSQYKYSGEQLSRPEVILVKDHHYDETTQCFSIEQLLKNSRCDPYEHIIVADHVLQHDDCLCDYKWIYWPTFMARENQEFIDQNIQSNWQHRTHTFNFMINKPRPHRCRLLELIQELELTRYTYSLPWRQIDPAINIEARTYMFGPEVVMDQGVRNGSFRNAHTYQGLLQTTVFEPSCISLITEPAYTEQETIITEKTLMAMYAGTLPIWVGGWRIPAWLQDHGFDIFDDIIDHSYQSWPDPRDRVDQAIRLNLSLLQNFDRSYDIVAQCHRRLQHNLGLLQGNYFGQLSNQAWNQMPKWVQDQLTNRQQL